MRDRNTAVMLRLTLVLLMIGRCGHVDEAFEQIEGRFFRYDKVEAIVDGRTSEGEVRQLLGEPFEERVDSTGLTTLRYYSVRRRENVEKGIFSTRKHWQKWTQELVVMAKDGRVVSHSYTAHTEEG